MDKQVVPVIVNDAGTGFSLNRDKVAEAIRLFAGKKAIFTIEHHKKQRSNRQNRYLHGVLLTVFAEELTKHTGNEYTMLKVKELCKFKFLKVQDVNEETGELIGEYIRDTSSLDTWEMNQFFDKIIQWGAESFSFNLPYPNENFE